MGKQIEDIAVIITARVNSQRVARKMVHPFAGSTLTDIAIEKIKMSSVIPKENFYLSAYDQELIEIGHKHGVNVFRRSEKSMLSEGQIVTEIYEWWDKLPHRYAVLINACNPFLKIETIDSFLRIYMDTDADGLFGVIPEKNYFWDDYGIPITEWPDNRQVMDTKVVAPVYRAAHCLYAGKMSKIGEGIWMGKFTKGDPELFYMDEMEALDIDHQWQFDLYETHYKTQGRKACRTLAMS